LLYLIQVRKAFEAYKDKATKLGFIKLREDESITDHIDYINVHLPYRKMGEKALAYLLRHEWRHLPRWQNIIDKMKLNEPIPKDPRGTIESLIADTEFMRADEKFRKEFMKTEDYREVFDKKMSSSLEASALIGNLYTASMYMGLRSLVEFENNKGIDLYNKRVGFGSYGSGCSAMVFSGIFQEQYKEIANKMNLDKEIGQRTKISIDDYEKLHNNTKKFSESFLNGENEFILVSIGGLTADRAGFREYCFAS
jgi:hydroxymethylglutaryl-CoA synthase